MGVHMKFVKRFLHVTWEDIERAERARDKVMEFELYDILESASIYGRELERVLEENIRYVLEREGLYDPKKIGSIVIPAGALHWECEEGTCFYTANFEVFDPSGNRILASGTATGTMHVYDDKAEILDMTVAIPTHYVKKLKEIVSGTKRLLATVLDFVR